MNRILQQILQARIRKTFSSFYKNKYGVEKRDYTEMAANFIFAVIREEHFSNYVTVSESSSSDRISLRS